MPKRTRSLIPSLSFNRALLGRSWRRFASGSTGFTLIELIVSVTIMILLVGGGIAAFITFNDKQQLQGSTKMLQTYMRTAQTKARVGDRPEDCDRLLGYQVGVAQGTSTITLAAICGETGNETELVVQTAELANVESIEVEGGGNLEVLFKVLHGGTEDSGDITVYSTGGASETFRVSAGGEISDLESSAPVNPGGSNNQPTPSGATSPSPTPSPTPGPTTLPVQMNSKTGVSCSQLCDFRGYVRCDSIGTDTAGTNGKYRSRIGNLCTEATGNCTTSMMNKNLVCNAEGTSAGVEWTYCKCSN